jgi:hypothetical protein
MPPGLDKDSTDYVGKPRRSAGLPAFLFTIAVTACLSGCMGVSGIPADPMGVQYEDRCYIEDSQFAFADQLYDRVGSLQLVDQELCNYYEWKRCEINEALYRLRKVHDLP